MIIAIETATTAVGVALIHGDDVIAEVTIGGRRHAETLVPAIQFLCAHTGSALSDAVAIGVDIGPGLFTGLRVGVATAQGLAMSLGIPVIGVRSLDALAARAPHIDGTAADVPDADGRGATTHEPWADAGRIPVATLLDARRGEVYAAAFVNGACVVEPFVAPPTDVATRIGAAVGLQVLLVGDAHRSHGDALRRVLDLRLAGDDHLAPRAAAVGRLAAKVFASSAHPELTTSLGEAGIVYLRAPDAEINWSTREPATAKTAVATPGAAS